MTKFLVLREWDTSKLPINNEDKVKVIMPLAGLTREFLKHGWTWGGFVDGYGGFCTYEGSQEDMMVDLLKLHPYIKGKVPTFYAKKRLQKWSQN